MHNARNHTHTPHALLIALSLLQKPSASLPPPFSAVAVAAPHRNPHTQVTLLHRQHSDRKRSAMRTLALH